MKIGKCKTWIDYTAGVKQGDNLAPTLLIIVMHFLSELLENKFKENDISMPSFFHNSNLYNKGGKLIRHETTINKGGKWLHITLVVLLLKTNYSYFCMSMMAL